ncbi:unnamed protein product [Prorocentrum cordatum]|uniref:Uncharacterized protein n=1 Tax=Prorocentrum cordatum TaxID=2364126 RepID=A0ABN9S7Z5_9DINO|nr:unnamed protein product [Polarella glacialis]
MAWPGRWRAASALRAPPCAHWCRRPQLQIVKFFVVMWPCTPRYALRSLTLRLHGARRSGVGVSRAAAAVPPGGAWPFPTTSMRWTSCRPQAAGRPCRATRSPSTTWTPWSRATRSWLQVPCQGPCGSPRGATALALPCRAAGGGRCDAEAGIRCTCGAVVFSGVAVGAQAVSRAPTVPNVVSHNAAVSTCEESALRQISVGIQSDVYFVEGVEKQMRLWGQEHPGRTTRPFVRRRARVDAASSGAGAPPLPQLEERGGAEPRAALGVQESRGASE